MRKREIEEGILRVEKFKQGGDRGWVEGRIGQRESQPKLKMFEKVISKWTGNQTKEHILYPAEVGTEMAHG